MPIGDTFSRWCLGEPAPRPVACSSGAGRRRLQVIVQSQAKQPTANAWAARRAYRVGAQRERAALHLHRATSAARSLARLDGSGGVLVVADPRCANACAQSVHAYRGVETRRKIPLRWAARSEVLAAPLYRWTAIRIALAGGGTLRSPRTATAAATASGSGDRSARCGAHPRAPRARARCARAAHRAVRMRIALA